MSLFFLLDLCLVEDQNRYKATDTSKEKFHQVITDLYRSKLKIGMWKTKHSNVPDFSFLYVLTVLMCLCVYTCTYTHKTSFQNSLKGMFVKYFFLKYVPAPAKIKDFYNLLIMLSHGGWMSLNLHLLINVRKSFPLLVIYICI